MMRTMMLTAVVTCALGLTQAPAAFGQNFQSAPAPVEVQFGSPQPQPAGAASHVLVPDEVTVFKDGIVSFVVNGGGHGIGIYEVANHTTREDIAEDLCQGGPTVCNPALGTANLQYIVTDRNGNVVIDSGTNPPLNRLNDPNHILMNADGSAFLVGTTPTNPASNSVQIRFTKTGRYLVICANRSHAIDDWMFGFVTVVGSDKD
jgi:hypothetical protein